MSTNLEALQEFQWQPCPEGQQLITALVDDHLASCPPSRQLATAMRERTGTRFADWLDHLGTNDQSLAAKLLDAGFTVAGEHDGSEIYEHHGAVFPRVLIGPGLTQHAALKVDAIVDFLAANSLSGTVEGCPFAPLRRARAWGNDNAALSLVERHGYAGFDPSAPDPATLQASRSHLEAFRTRRRAFDTDDHAFASIHTLLDAAIADLGHHWTADLWFDAERRYWMQRNRAARVQKARQDTLGLGWANHDHHTYRCRRATFAQVIAVFEKLGCYCRERFYAGADAGWGAQVLEQPVTGIVIFADVDMDPTEVTGDFSHLGFDQRDELGTVGLWCELHGESILEAGMHHLECQFDFDALREQIKAEAGIDMMKPFTDFDHLRQQFTEGERWSIDPARIDRLLAQNQITAEQAERFRREGAIGSHLENLERNDGFKGFNQSGINEIILATDPRKLSNAPATA